jgi:hypothetical protein
MSNFIDIFAIVEIKYDEIGIWSEVKLVIVRQYASAYTRILDCQRRERIPSLRWHYIDAFAGPGTHLCIRGEDKTDSDRIWETRNKVVHPSDKRPAWCYSPWTDLS